MRFTIAGLQRSLVHLGFGLAEVVQRPFFMPDLGQRLRYREMCGSVIGVGPQNHVPEIQAFVHAASHDQSDAAQVDELNGEGLVAQGA